MKTIYYSRAVLLYVMSDGTLTFHPVKGLPPTGHTGDWRDIAIDALLDEKIEHAADVIAMSKHDPMLPEREQELFTLPIFSVDTLDEAKTIQIRFCRLMYGENPLLDQGERWYVISSWVESNGLAELYRVQKLMAAFYIEMQKQKLKELQRCPNCLQTKTKCVASGCGQRISRASTCTVHARRQPIHVRAPDARRGSARDDRESEECIMKRRSACCPNCGKPVQLPLATRIEGNFAICDACFDPANKHPNVYRLQRKHRHDHI